MESVPVRELQQHASAVLRRVRSGERVAVTDRGTIVAVLVPPSDAGGMAGLTAAGRVRPAQGPWPSKPAVRLHATTSIADVLDELRADD